MQLHKRLLAVQLGEHALEQLSNIDVSDVNSNAGILDEDGEEISVDILVR